MHRLPFSALALLCLAVMLVPCPAKADLSLSFNTPFDAALVPSGSPPWLTALFETISSTQVRLTIDNKLTAPQFVSEISFNYDGDPDEITPTLPPTGSGASAFVSLSTETDDFKADGDGYYDILLNFNMSGDRFVGGEQLVVILTRAAGLSPADFAQLSKPSGGHGPYLAAAHVQSIPGGTSSWVAAQVTAVPEPSAVLLFGACLAGVIYRIRRR
jgi:hypothetical protein